MAAVLDDKLADLDRWVPGNRCSIVRALDVVGTKTAMLIMRESMYGTTRFDGFARRVGVSDAVAAARLKALVAEGLLEKAPYQEPGQRTRFEYRLTEKGADLVPVLFGLMQWGDKYCQPKGKPLEMVSDKTGAPVHVTVSTPDGVEVPLDELRISLVKR
ncbi:MAG: transcriptional regulator [Gordonia sp.]|jgi:DNA-binding HxlR family transcriptional regulator|uniref:Helix-turn-helix domain-containing protein n=1 Tax=Gordonia rubripertincta TaxID=36822 RepID=A0ABT4MSA0_GORRU|nr:MULTISPECIES: helix-turn-helix domain-containing protein [Mycobacteriales]MBA4023847.1 transcriptional regulator [Gordonia sp. (in: high G+C Gram-positive bacteria)]MCZ4549873.1 helix-turn-helix domain-containing protein [Gordonia rubripertincta]OZG25908.1 transcriptional regulator [Williamsia sp. 1138]